MKIRMYFICSLISVSLISCYGPSKLQHSLNEYIEPLEYTFDSTIDTLKSNQKVYLKILDNLGITDSTKVREDGMFVLPLVIAGGYKYDLTVTLGKKSVNPSFSQFVFESFKIEAKRSGTFEIVDKKFRSNYVLEIALIDCQISAKYHKDAFGYGHNYKHNWILKPITGTFKIESRLIKKNNLVFSKTYTSSKTSQPKTFRFNYETEMNKQLMESFARTASQEIKEIVELAIQDVNKQFNQD
jgi:hypothetical protein